MKQRLDQVLVKRGLVTTRSQANSYTKLGEVKVDGQVVTKPATLVAETSKVEVTAQEQYVSRAALKLASVTEALQLNFQNKTILDVGSSTGGFTDYALRRGARKVMAVEIGSNQLHASLRADPRVELHEQTDIRDFVTDEKVDIVVIDVSFVSLREILPAIASLIDRQTQIVAMVKPQFEAIHNSLKHKGVIKNDKLRRTILKDFEAWAQSRFVLQAKADSSISGAQGNQERFYLLRKT